MTAIIATLQGGYFLLTGVWPLISMATFLGVTGPKTDLWLVKTVGAIIGVIGGVLLIAGMHGRVTPEIALLAAGSAAALACVDVIYTLKRTIAPIYLADAVAEIILLVFWVFASLRG